MKKHFIFSSVIFCFSTSFASMSLCEKVAISSALKSMDKKNQQGLVDDNNQPRSLTFAEKAQVNQVDFLDDDGSVVENETNVYGVQMGVMEECIDGLKITTQAKGNSCEVIKVESYLDRDCG